MKNTTHQCFGFRRAFVHQLLFIIDKSEEETQGYSVNGDVVLLEFKNSESLEFDFATIEIATNMFSEESKIGGEV
ncbi:hypothetical protein MTR_5g069370 [Medicago truncatula]|uniref:Uncharacterized protein n=1 Tax=Medicago truncatula TaxID=3880 RepID=G7KE12_MEDTR|nr:hypothetical protein MTR_5g069370 [Medicago truncatula]